MIKEDLQSSAAYIRAFYLKKPFPKSNVAIADIYLSDGFAFCAGATSKGKGKSPIPEIPLSRSQGGQFDPSVDSRTNRLMDTDAEYKVLSKIAETINEKKYDRPITGNLYLYSELQPCESCDDILRQFRAKFPNIKIELFWDYPYPYKL